MRGADCETLAATVSERRSGELAPDAERALDAHLAACAHCREEARSLEAMLASLAPPEVTPAELLALSARRIGKTPPRPAPSQWGVRAVLVAAAAAALLTFVTRPRLHHPPRTTSTAPMQGASEEEFFDDDVFLDDDLSGDGATLDALTLEGPGIFGNLDR